MKSMEYQRAVAAERMRMQQRRARDAAEALKRRGGGEPSGVRVPQDPTPNTPQDALALVNAG